MLQQYIAEKCKRLTSFEDVRKRSDDRLKHMLRHVLLHSAFYKEYYASHGIRYKDVEFLSIEDLPFTSKELLMNNFDRVSHYPAVKFGDISQYADGNNDCNGFYQDAFKVIKTSGSSGSYGMFVYDKKGWNVLRSIAVNRVGQAGINPFKKKKLAAIVDINGLHAGISLLGSAPKLLYDILVINIHEPQQIIADKLNAFQPDLLTGYANGIYMCALDQLSGKLSVKLQQVCCSGELLTADARKTIEQAFGVPPTNMYAASESICIAASTPQCAHLHVAYDWNIVEVLDGCGNTIPDGVAGNAVLTNLYNYAFPLIRYQMNDRIAMVTRSCPDCGSVFPVITRIEGRNEDIMYFRRDDGSTENLFCSFITYFNIPNVKSFRVVQKERNFLEIQIVFIDKRRGQETVDQIDISFRDMLAQKNLTSTVRYAFVPLDSILANSKTGKMKHIITFEKYMKSIAAEEVAPLVMV